MQINYSQPEIQQKELGDSADLIAAVLNQVFIFL